MLRASKRTAAILGELPTIGVVPRLPHTVHVLIPSQFLRNNYGDDVALITSDSAAMDKHRMNTVVGLFQDDAAVLEQNPGIRPPRFIVSTTGLIGVGLTLHRATKLVQVEPEWMLGAELQARKRVHRIGQKHATQTWSLIMKDSKVEKIIHDRQNRRLLLLEMGLNLDKMMDDVGALGAEEAAAEDDQDGQSEGTPGDRNVDAEGSEGGSIVGVEDAEVIDLC